MYEAKDLKFPMDALKGISKNTIENHYEKLYKGYVAKYNEIKEQLAIVDREKANQTYSEYRGLKDGLSFSLDAIILHELYFDNLGGKKSWEGLEVAGAIIDQHGSMEEFQDNLVASGMAARGWSVLGINPLDGKFVFFQCDQHNQGGIWNAVPILVLDVYEHAYFMDYGTDRKSYLNVFWENLDWAVINDRYLSR